MGRGDNLQLGKKIIINVDYSIIIKKRKRRRKKREIKSDSCNYNLPRIISTL